METLMSIDEQGTVTYLDSDALIPLRKRLGEASIRRAAHVEPKGDVWWVDLSPSGGPIIGPFEARCDALAAEQEWLNNHLFGSEPPPEEEEAATDMLWEGCPNAHQND